MTDTVAPCRKKDLGFAAHETVNHMRGKYVRGDAYTNTAEGFFSIFKRGMTGSQREKVGVSDSIRTEKTFLWSEGKTSHI